MSRDVESLHTASAAGSEAKMPLIHAQTPMAQRISTFDWAKTPLGPIQAWPSNLISSVNLMLSSPQPALLMWGEDLTVIYNDGVLAALGEKHPGALGRRYRDIFAEVWEAVRLDVEDCFHHGRTTIQENVHIPLLRNGVPQDDYYTYYLVPIYDGGKIAGVYNPFFDVTQQRAEQISRERAITAQKFLLALSDAQRSATSGREVLEISAEMLGLHLGADRVGYAEATSDSKSMILETGWAQGRLQPLSGSAALEHWSKGTSTDFLHGRTVVYPDVRSEQGLVTEVQNYEDIGAIAVIAVPFLRRGVWRGALYVNQAEPRRWTPQEVSLVEEVAIRTNEAVERARAEEEIRAVADRLSMAQKAGLMASWEWDFITDALVWDGGSEWTYGRPPYEMKQSAVIFSYIHEDDREKVRRELMPAIAGTGEYRCEFRVFWPDGSMHWIQAFGRTLWSANGTPVGVVGLNVNITEQKKAEVALMQTEKLAAVGRLASTMAHEVNNPLEAVTNLLYLARQAGSLAEVHSFLETAAPSCNDHKSGAALP